MKHAKKFDSELYSYISLFFIYRDYSRLKMKNTFLNC
jgi:hypothetical protein